MEKNGSATTRNVVIGGVLLAVLMCFSVWISDTETDQQTPGRMISVVGSEDCGMEAVLLERAIKQAETLGNFVLTKDEYQENVELRQEVAFPVPLSYSPNILLDMMTDLHKSAKPAAKHRQSSQHIAIAHSPGQLHIFRPEKYPKGVLTLPVLCSTRKTGIYAWGAAGLHDDPKGIDKVPVLTASELYSLYEEGKITESDIASNPFGSEVALRSVALSETASYLLRASEILAASLVSDNYTGLEAILRSLRNTLSKDVSSAEHVISSLQPASLQSGVSFSLPFSFLAPSPPPALSYALLEPSVFSLVLPQELLLNIFNPTNSELTHAPFGFVIETTEDCFLRARLENGLCEVVNYEQVEDKDESNSGSGSRSDEEEGSGTYKGEKKHEIACVLDDVPAMTVKSVSVKMKKINKPPAAAEGTSGDSATPTVSNTCYAASYLGNGVVKLTHTSSKHSESPPEEVTLQFSVVISGEHREGLPSPFSVLCSFMVLFFVALIVSVAIRRYSTSSKLFLLLSRFNGSYITAGRMDVVYCLFGFGFCFFFSPPVTDTATYRTLLLPVIVVTALGGLSRCALFISGALGRVVLALIVGSHVNFEPAWPTTSVSKVSGIGVVVDQGRLADDLILTYLPYEGITTTITAWHGDECRLDIEHWSGKTDGFEVDIRTVVTDFSPATISGSFGEFQYKPHSSKSSNTITTRDPIVLHGGHKSFSLIPQQTVSFSIQQSLSGVVIDSRLSLGEGFAISAVFVDTNSSINSEPRSRQGVLVLNPITTSSSVLSEIKPELLRPPSGIHLTRVRSWDIEATEALLITLHNVRNVSLPVMVSEICRLPKCDDAKLYIADHFGSPSCEAKAVDFLSGGAYRTYIVSKVAPC